MSILMVLPEKAPNKSLMGMATGKFKAALQADAKRRPLPSTCDAFAVSASGKNVKTAETTATAYPLLELEPAGSKIVDGSSIRDTACYYNGGAVKCTSSGFGILIK